MKFRTLFAVAASALVTWGAIAATSQPGVNSTLNTVFTYGYELTSDKPTYSAVSQVQPAATPTDVCALTGSATKLIRVRRIAVGGTANAVIVEPISIVKHTVGLQGGTSTALAANAYDTSSSAATAVVDVITGNPNPAIANTPIADLWVTYANFTTGTGSNSTIFNFGPLAQSIILRGTAQNVSVNLSGQNPAGLQLMCWFEWTEE